MAKNKPNITLKGSKKSGWVITIYGRDAFIADIALTNEELILIQKLIESRL